MSKAKREQLQFLHTVAACAMRAAEHNGCSRAMRELRECIERTERDHRAFGRRLVGDIGARMTVQQSVDYFVARTLMTGARTYKCGKAPIRMLEGIRDDYIKGAVLMANDRFREAFYLQLASAFPSSKSTGEIFDRIEETDYSALVAAHNVSKVSA